MNARWPKLTPAQGRVLRLLAAGGHMSRAATNPTMCVLFRRGLVARCVLPNDGGCIWMATPAGKAMAEATEP